MFDSKYGNLLTILLIVLIVVIVGLLAFLGYDIYKKYFITKEATEALEQFDNQTSKRKSDNNVIDENTIGTGNVTNPYEELVNSTGGNTSGGGTSQEGSGGATVQYKGFNMMGKIKIPKTQIEYPVLETVTKKSIEVAVAILYGPGLNQKGNTVIVGHNYRNGLFFSNNKKLENGDKIYITDKTGSTVKYNIYNIFTTTPEDSDYMVRDTNGTREISLSTCTDDSKSRLIICAREE